MIAMLPLYASMGMLLALNLVFAGVALVVGFAVGGWYFSGAGQRKTATDQRQDSESRCATERAMMASQRIQDLAKNMVSDVDSHAGKVEEFNTELHAFADSSPGDEPNAVFDTISRMIDANKELQSRLARAEKQIAVQAADLRSFESEARTDCLTNLANRRAFDDEMQRRVAEWNRRRTPFVLMILDIDHFKKFNDSHGHLAGDEVLRNVAKVLAKTAREVDLPCRYGGEEFAVLLPATGIQEACIAAERYRKAIESATVKFEGKSLSVTTSIGVAAFGPAEDSAEMLVRRADEALYKSKQSGRNRCHWHDGSGLRQVADMLPKPSSSKPSPAATSDPKKSTTASSTFVDYLHRRINESQRFGVPLSVMHLQVDDYAEVLQQYGKPVAGILLDSVSQLAQSALREMDLLARLDEGRFVVLMPGSTLLDATQVAKRLHAAAATCVLPLEQCKTRLNLSHGIAELRPNDTADSLLGRAKSIVAAQNLNEVPVGG